MRRLDWLREFTGRTIRNEFTERWHGRERQLEEQLEGEYERYRVATAAADPKTSVVWAGEGVDLIDAIEPTEVVMARLVLEASAALEAVKR